MSETPQSSVCVVTTYFNPANYQSRLRNYHAFVAGMQRSQVGLLTLELAFGHQPFSLEAAPDRIQIRTDDIMWQRERLLNLALRRLPAHVANIAWIDCDLLFSRPDWPERALALLERFSVVQLFNQLIYLTKDPTQSGPAFLTAGSVAQVTQTGNPLAVLAQGGAWMARRELLEKHGFYDACILGGNDTAIVLALYGRFDHPWLRTVMNERFRCHYEHWARPFFADVAGRVSYLPETIYHLWHGHLADRNYMQRWQGLREFDPRTDLRIGSDGCWHWASDKKELHAWVADYFRRRHEDAPYSCLPVP